MKEAQLPEYATLTAKGKVRADASKFYPLWLDYLGVAVEDRDQYWVTVALNCMKLEIQRAIEGTESEPEAGGALMISVFDPDKVDGESPWAVKNLPEGKGEEAAVATDEFGARAHFQRVMKSMPVGFLPKE